MKHNTNVDKEELSDIEKGAYLVQMGDDVDVTPISAKSEPPRDKINKMICAPCEYSDQPGHPPSLIRVFAVRLMSS